MLAVIQVLQYENLSITEFLGQILQDPSYMNHPLVTDLHSNGSKICDMILKTTPLSSTLDEGPSAVKSWALNTSLKYFEKELDNLMHTATDWRFSASHATAQRIEDFKIENNAPQIWTMLSGLLQVKRKAKPSAMDNARVTDESHQDWVEEEDEYWGNLDGVDLGGFIDLLTSEDGSHIKETQNLGIRLRLGRCPITLHHNFLIW